MSDCKHEIGTRTFGRLVRCENCGDVVRELNSDPCSVERTSRQVIERKLLTALEDGNTVAALFSKQDLEDIIAALRGYVLGDRFGDVVHGDKISWKAHMDRRRALAEGMEQLLREAFPLTNV